MSSLGSPEHCHPAQWSSRAVSGAGPVSLRGAFGSEQRLVLGLCVAQVLLSQVFHFWRKHLGPITSAGLQRGMHGAGQPYSVSSGLIALSEQVPLLIEGCSSGPSQHIWSGQSLAECCPAGVVIF